MSESKRRPHLIRRRDDSAWLAGSAVNVPTRHWTSAASARRIVAEGVHIEQTELDTTWGQGFYATTGFRPDIGDTPVSVAIRLERPFVAVDRIAALEQIDELLARAESEDVRAVLLAAGYDGVLVHWESGEMWVVAFEGDQVKVIDEG
jgi:hypothetical protein